MSKVLKLLKYSVAELSSPILDAVRVGPFEIPRHKPLFAFPNASALSQLVGGSDEDIGGFSNTSLSHNNDPNFPAAVFKGTISTQVPSSCDYAACGYAGLRTRSKPPTLFGRSYHNFDRFEYLELVAKNISPPPDKLFYVNIKATTYAELDLYQYPLHFKSRDWETFRIPLRHFVLTHKGFVLEVQRPIPLDQVDAVGVSILRQDGDFHLEINRIGLCNPPGLCSHELLDELIKARESGDVHRAILAEKKWTELHSPNF